MDKVVANAAEAVADIRPGATVAVGGFGLCGMMEHVARDGSFKIVDECTLPRTGRGVVQRIITDLAVIDVTPDGLVLVELVPGVTEDEVRRSAEPQLTVRVAAAAPDENRGGAHVRSR